MAKGGIYKITNTRTGESYIGQTNNFQRRKAEHFIEMSRGTHHNRGLQRDYNQGHTFNFTELVEEPNKSRRDQLEKQYISKYNTYYGGYNQTIDGQYPSKRTTGYSKPKPNYSYRQKSYQKSESTSKSSSSDDSSIPGIILIIMIISIVLGMTGIGGNILSGIGGLLIILLVGGMCCSSS